MFTELEQEEKLNSQIEIGDIVYHTWSKLFFKCLNKKQKEWMNCSVSYIKADKAQIPIGFYRL